MKLLRLLIVPVLAVALNVIVSAGATHAQSFGDDTFDINSFNYYCTAGSATCNPAFVSTSTTNPGFFCANGYDTCADLNYAAVQASGDMTGTANGTPGLVTLTCENFTGSGQFNAGYVNVSTNAFYDTWGGGAPGYQADDYWVYALSHGPWGMTSDSTYYPSALGAKATILSATEDATNATSSVTVSAYDAYWGTFGSVTGIQNTDNENDTPLGGQFRITIRSTTGGLYHFYNNGNSFYPYSGTISCTAGGPNATAIGAALNSYYTLATPWRTGSYGAEGETEDYPLYEYDHNCAYAPIFVHDPFGGTGNFRCEGLGIPRG